MSPQRRRRASSNFIFFFLVIFVGAAIYLLFLQDMNLRDVPPEHIQPAPPTVFTATTRETFVYGPADVVVDTGSELRPVRSTSSMDSDLRLMKGRAVVNVARLRERQTFRLITPNATVGVRGTQFLVDVIGGGALTYVQVFHGTVWVQGTTGEVMTLHAGEAVHIQGMSPPEPAGPQFDPSGTPIGNAENSAAARGSAVTISGTGTWTGSLGFTGPVTISIDRSSGRFSGTFSGETSRGGTQIRIDGEFEGDYLGDEKRGDLEGAAVFKSAGREGSGRVSAVHSAGKISGTFSGAPADGEFSVDISQ